MMSQCELDESLTTISNEPPQLHTRNENSKFSPVNIKVLRYNLNLLEGQLFLFKSAHSPPHMSILVSYCPSSLKYFLLSRFEIVQCYFEFWKCLRVCYAHLCMLNNPPATDKI